MKLGKKLRYIILPVIVLVSAAVTSIYYGIYKTQLIDNKIYSLNEYLKNTVMKSEYELAYAQSYLQHKIDSKEASLIFTQNELGIKLTAPYISQFLEQFIDKTNKKSNPSHIVNDFIIYDKNEKLIIHINTQDPFAAPILQEQTQTILDKIKNNPNQKISQYYYFIDNTEHRLFNIIQVFSPYQLTSKQHYDPHDDLYITQTQLGRGLIRVAIEDLIKANHGFITSKITLSKNTIIDKISANLVPFQSMNHDAYQAKIETELFTIEITLDESYFAKDLNAFLIKLILVSLILIGLSYFVVVRLIDKQIIFPITALAKSIKEVEASLTVELKPLSTDDEVSDLNESYISLITKINNLANNDPLTGLANRASFNETLYSLPEIKNTHYIALFFIDLDNFKYVNDTCGHDTGDLLLITFSQRLKNMLRMSGNINTNQQIMSIARLGGDEFVILLSNMTSISEIQKIGKQICHIFDDSFNIGSNKFTIHASVGIAYTKDKTESGEVLLNQADSAMYLAKSVGKNNYKLYTAELENKINNEIKIGNKLTDAIQNNELQLVFMPAYCAASFELKGYEVLLRCPTLTNIGVGPDIFIPIAEQTDLILMIDLWVAEHAFIKLQELTNKTDFAGFFAINVSSKSLRNDDFYIRLKALIDKYDLDVKQIELEITETCLMPEDYQAITSLKQLKSLGVSIAIDDFGTGYTSFNQLVNYPLDTLKIDRSFVQSLSNTPIGKKPTLDIIYELAKVYELEVIVEGIETEADIKHAQLLPDVMVQGFYFTMPQTWEDVVIECEKNKINESLTSFKTT